MFGKDTLPKKIIMKYDISYVVGERWNMISSMLSGRWSVKMKIIFYINMVLLFGQKMKFDLPQIKIFTERLYFLF